MPAAWTGGAVVSLSDAYEKTANVLVDRMVAALKANPGVKVDDCWGMLKVPGFKCDDLSTSFFQAAWAFSKARALIKGGA